MPQVWCCLAADHRLTDLLNRLEAAIVVAKSTGERVDEINTEIPDRAVVAADERGESR